MTRLRLVKRMRVNDPELEMIVQLAKAGMSYKCIAQEAYGASTEYHIARVNYILSSEGTRVTDYRNGKNKIGRAMIAAIRREADVLGAIRAAATMITPKIRKIG